MKKLFLLTTAALSLTISANAAVLPFGETGWTTDGGSVSSIESVTPSVKITISKDGNAWDGQFVSPCYKGLEGQVWNEESPVSFTFKAQMKYESLDGAPSSKTPGVRLATGKNHANQGSNTQLIKADGGVVAYFDGNTSFTDTWTDFTREFFIGKEGGDSIWFELDFGTAAGNYYFKNIQIIINGKVVDELCMEEPETPIEEEPSPWVWTTDGGSVSSVTTTEEGIKIEIGKDGNLWDGQLVAPCYKGLEGQAWNEDSPVSFVVKAQMKYESIEDKPATKTPGVRLATGKNHANQGSNTQLIKADGGVVSWNDQASSFSDANTWTDFTREFFIGKEGADSIWFELDFGAAAGNYYFKNVQVIVNGIVVDKQFVVKEDTSTEGDSTGEEGDGDSTGEEGDGDNTGEGGEGDITGEEGEGGNTNEGDNTGTEDNTGENGKDVAISDAAANSLNAYVANGVVYTSEVANIVVYNINGVVCKVVNNASSVNIADLNSGLYIVKVSANSKSFTTKFVK